MLQDYYHKYELPINSRGFSYFPSGLRKGFFVRQNYEPSFGFGEYAHLPAVHGAEADAKDQLLGFARSCADFHAYIKGCSVNNFTNKFIKLSALVCAPDLEQALFQAKYYLSAGYKNLKIKVGAVELDYDIAKIKAIAKLAGPYVSLRLDANQSLSFEQALSLTKNLAGLNIEYLEEPTASLESLALLHKKTGINLAVDESFSPGDDLAVLARAQVKFLILKASRFKSILELSEVISNSKSLGLTPILSTCFESEFSTSLWAMLAHQENMLAQAHGIFTGDFFTSNVFEQNLEQHEGQLSLSLVFKALLNFDVAKSL